MAKKKRRVKQRQQKTPSLDTLSPEKLWERAKESLRQERFQDAIAAFKQLAKLEQGQEALYGLGQAYIGRIEGLAAKSMVKEALALLETMMRRCPGIEVESLRMSLLLQAGRHQEAGEVYRKIRQGMDRQRIQRLECLFGAVLLTETALHPEDLGEESAAAHHYPLAAVALGSFFAGTDDQTREALRQIPIRSPYRDLRTLLTGLLLVDKDPEKARVFLEKIESDSPYFRFVGRQLAGFDPPEVILEKLRGADNQEKQRVRDQYGLSAAQLRIACDLTQPGIQPLRLYKMVDGLGKNVDQHRKNVLLCNILPFCAEHTVGLVLKHPELGILEQLRIGSLAAENNHAFFYATQGWLEYLEKLGEINPGATKEQAMVLRRLAAAMRKEPYEFEPREILDALQHSLKLDPHHSPTWLDAANYARKYEGLKPYYGILNEAVKHLPEHVDILTAAMTASGQRRAFKKAAGLADRILAIDPINTKALNFLVEAHLEHGRKLASQGKWELAEKELRQADTRVRAVRLRGRNLICLGMVFLLQGDKGGLEQIEAGRKVNGLPVLSHILVALEARLYGLPKQWQKRFDQELREVSLQNEWPDVAEFGRLIGWMLSFTGQEFLWLKQLCQCLKKYFSRAAELEWGRDEGVSLCEALDRFDLQTALARCVRQLAKQFPDDPEIRIWYLDALYAKPGKVVPDNLLRAYEDLSDDLAAEHNYELLERLEDILDTLLLESESAEEMFEEDFDFGPFRLPSGSGKSPKGQGGEKTKPKKQSPDARQLDLFDDLFGDLFGDMFGDSSDEL